MVSIPVYTGRAAADAAGLRRTGERPPAHATCGLVTSWPQSRAVPWKACSLHSAVCHQTHVVSSGGSDVHVFASESTSRGGRTERPEVTRGIVDVVQHFSHRLLLRGIDGWGRILGWARGVRLLGLLTSARRLVAHNRARDASLCAAAQPSPRVRVETCQLDLGRCPQLRRGVRTPLRWASGAVLRRSVRATGRGRSWNDVSACPSRDLSPMTFGFPHSNPCKQGGRTRPSARDRPCCATGMQRSLIATVPHSPACVPACKPQL